MIRLDEDALICDFAETYHIYDYRSLPASRAATFAVGMRDTSRIKSKMAGLTYPVDTMLAAAAVDRLSLLFWAKTEDGQKGRNRPASIYDALTGAKKQSPVMSFDSGDDFERWRTQIIRGGGS